MNRYNYTRYMRSNLEQDVAQMNEGVKRDLKRTRYLHVSGRNGYTALDEYGPNHDGRIVCLRNIQCGTPRECRDAAYDWCAP